MVKIPLPPPVRRPDPVHVTLPAGRRLVRIFDPTSHGATATSFRTDGPALRFDHQRGAPGGTVGDDLERGIYYAAATLSCCLVERFGDEWVIGLGEHHVAQPALRRPLRLLDLRGPAAMRAGIASAIAKVEDRAVSQAWARYFYERADLYGPVDGLAFFGAHNDEVAYALFERAHDALACGPDWISRLDHPKWRGAILATAKANNLLFFGGGAGA